MAKSKIIEHTICPYCNGSVIRYERDARFSLTKRKSKIWFHYSCYMQDIEKQKAKMVGGNNAIK